MTTVIAIPFLDLVIITYNHTHDWIPVIFNLNNEEVGWICKCGAHKDIYET